MKLLLAATIVTMAFNAHSQSNLTVSVENKTLATTEDSIEMTEETDNSIIKVDKSLPNGIMLYGTKMVVVKNGIMREMLKDVFLPNGTRVRTDGSVYKKNKPKMLLNFGEYIDASGKILPMENINSFTN